MDTAKSNQFNFRVIKNLLFETYSQFLDDKAFKMAAALSYYTIFSLTPLLIIIIAIAGLVFGEEAVRGQLVLQLEDLVGRDGATLIQAMIKGASVPVEGIFATLFSLIVLILGSVGVFLELQESLNIIWGVEQKPGRAIAGFFKNRLMSFSMVISISFILLVSLIINAAIAALQKYVGANIPELIPILNSLNIAASFIIITILFAVIFKYLPDVIIEWKYVFIGAGITSLLFNLGKLAIGYYLGSSSYSSTYGAAASLVILLIWIFYSGLILFFGAEFTQVYRRKYGKRELTADNDGIIIPKISQLVKSKMEEKLS